MPGHNAPANMTEPPVMHTAAADENITKLEDVVSLKVALLSHKIFQTLSFVGMGE